LALIQGEYNIIENKEVLGSVIYRDRRAEIFGSHNGEIEAIENSGGTPH
jgi:hypothetical protein